MMLAKKNRVSKLFFYLDIIFTFFDSINLVINATSIGLDNNEVSSLIDLVKLEIPDGFEK